MTINDKLGFIYLSHGKTVLDVPDGVQPGDIIFYEDKHQIIVDSKVFGVTDDQASAISEIAGIKTRVEMTTELSTTILAILRDTRSKLDGATLGKQGWTGAQSIQGIQGIQTDNTVAAINALNAYINGIQTRLNNTVAGVASVNDLTGAVKLNGTNISTTSGAGPMFGQQTLDTAFKGVQFNIDGIQGRLDDDEEAMNRAISGVQGQINSAVTGIQTQLGESISGVQTEFDTKLGDFGNQSAKSYVDNVAAETLEGAQKTAKTYVDELAGTDWTDKAKTVQAIIKELSDSGNPEFESFIDKVRGDYSYDGNGGQQSVKGYIDHAVGSAQSGAQTLAGTAETNANDYTDTKIAGLDGTQSDNYNNGSVISGHVGVQVTQEDGKIKSIDIVENDIASATALQSVQTELVGAQSKIGAAETKIDNVENQLTWRVV